MIRVILADDHHLIRESLAALLERNEDIQVIGKAATGQEAVDLAVELGPEVVVMDISMPRLDGAQAAGRLLSLEKPPAIVMLSIHSDPVLIQQLVRQGVKGYLLKISAPEELPLAIRSASQGDLFLSPAVCDSVMNNYLAMPADGEPQKAADLLTPREREVLQLISEGYTNKAVGAALNITMKTVEKHRANLMEKLGVQDLASLIRVALEQGLIFSDMG